MNIAPKTSSILRTLILSFVLIFVMVLASQGIGLGKAGFDSTAVLSQYFFYAGPGIGFLVGILLIFFVELLVKEGDSEYGDSLSFNSPGELPAIPWKWFRNTWRLVLLSIIVFSLFGLYSTYTHTSFTGIGTLQHQFTVFDNVVFNGALVPASENLGAAFAWAFVLFCWRQFCRKRKLGKASFVIIAVLLAILTFIAYGYINHQMRYSNDETAITNVLFFWGLGGLVTVLTGSFIPFWIMHIINNLFWELAKQFSSDIIAVWTGGVIIAISVIFILLYVRRKGKNDKPSFKN